LLLESFGPQAWLVTGSPEENAGSRDAAVELDPTFICELKPKSLRRV